MRNYEVWIEDYDDENDWRSVGDQFDAGTAAEHAAERFDTDGDYTLRNGDTIVVHVKRSDGQEFVFNCGAEMTVQYTATYVSGEEGG